MDTKDLTSNEYHGGHVFAVLRWALDMRMMNLSAIPKSRFEGIFYSLIKAYFPFEKETSFGLRRQSDGRFKNSHDFWVVFEAFCDENARRIMESSREYLIGEQSGFIYLKANSHYEYKIGLSKDPITRSRKITKGSSPLFNLHVVPTDHMPSLEDRLHKKYDHRKIRYEWYDLSNDMVEEICAMKFQKISTEKRVRMFSCQEIIVAAQSIQANMSMEDFRIGWLTGTKDGEVAVELGYSCANLDPNYCTGYINGYYVAQGELELGDLLDFSKLPRCSESEEE